MGESEIEPNVEQRFITKEQLAERYQCSPRSIDRLRKEEGFPEPTKIGRLCRWQLKPVVDWEETRNQ